MDSRDFPFGPGRFRHQDGFIRQVPPFLKAAHQVMAKERQGEYPGCRERRFQRYAWFGGIITFWTKRALRAHLYREAVTLAAAGSPMILAAVVRRSVVWVKGRRPMEALELYPTGEEYGGGHLNLTRFLMPSPPFEPHLRPIRSTQIALGRRFLWSPISRPSLRSGTGWP